MAREARSKRGRRGAVLIFLTLALPFFVGLVGLGIDATMCYIVQTELSAAVDGAALGAGRLISQYSGTDSDKDIANEFLNANFRVGQSGFWGANTLTPNITVTNGITKTVTVTATAYVPLLFMRLLHQNNATVAAGAVATRRDARIEIVIDRSGSMGSSDGAGSTVIQDVVTKATSFVQQFTSCTTASCATPLDFDEVGLVVFSGSAVVGYPTYTTAGTYGTALSWPASIDPKSAGGPDILFNNSAATNLPNQLGAVTAGDGTAMGDALALAYIELQKAHVADMAHNGNVDTRVNAIVLFTDGVPSSVVTYLNQSKDPNTVLSSGSGCTYRTDAAGTHPIYGYVTVGGSPPYLTSAKPGGFYQLASLYTGETSAQWMSAPTKDMSISAADTTVDMVPSAGLAGCTKSSWANMTNLSFIPSFDKYGYPLTANMTGGVAGYNLSSLVGGGAAKITSSGDGDFDVTKKTEAYQWGLAQWNEVDNVAQAIRSDANCCGAGGRGEANPMPITIYTIGYTGTGGTDAGLLQKIANVAACKVNTYSCVVTGQQQGIYAQASDADAISNAFNVILTAILRLKT